MVRSSYTAEDAVYVSLSVGLPFPLRTFRKLAGYFSRFTSIPLMKEN